MEWLDLLWQSNLVNMVIVSRVETDLPSQDKAAQKAQKATKNAPKAGPGRVGGKR